MSQTDAESVHTSVLREEVIEILSPANAGVYVDATLGMGGHAEAILLSSPDSSVIAIDQDPEALEIAQKRLAKFAGRVRYFHGNFSQIREAVQKEQVTGIVADLGVSSLQLDSETRGFSFRFDAPLDMRMDASSTSMTVADLLKTADESEIANIIYTYGEERASRRIAKWIVEKREAGEPIETTQQLADLVRRAVRSSPKDKIHPATRTFQALRIAVNNEIDILDGFINDAVDLLKTDGRLAIITFHSLEDRIVKRAFQRLSGRCSCPPRKPICDCGAVKKVEILTRKPIVPTAAEMQQNPRSRSAEIASVPQVRQLNFPFLEARMIKRRSSPQTKRRTSVRTYFLIFVCGLLTVSGFFFAGRQHFSWMDYGMKNSRLRKQIDDLQAEKRRLLLARESSLSPDEIKKAAKKFMTADPAGQPTATTATTVAAIPNKPQPARDVETPKPMVEKTVSVASTAMPVTAAFRRADKPKQPTKVTAATE